MHFIGIFTDSRNFELIKGKLLKNLNSEKFNIININKNNIENFKHILFETIVFCNNTKISENYNSIIEEICSNAKYIIINADEEIKINLLKYKKTNIITYGLNHKSTITISSVNDNSILISLQRNIENINKKVIEMGESLIKKEEKSILILHDLLVIFAILLIYN